MLNFLRKWFFPESKELSDHTVPTKVLEARKRLCEIWNDYEIFDCTDEAAHNVLVYKNFGQGSAKNPMMEMGVCIFYWDVKNINKLKFASILHLHQSVVFHFTISSDGKLYLDKKSYDNPQSFIDSITLEQHQVFSRVNVDPKSPLGLTLNQSFHHDCKILFPPDYPPFLILVALANHDYIQAIKILEHPVVYNPEEQPKFSARFRHVLEVIMPTVIHGKHLNFFDYFMKKFDPLNPETKDFIVPLKFSILSGSDDVSIHVIESYPKDNSKHVFQLALIETAKYGKETFFKWLLKHLPDGTTIPSDDSIEFLANVLTRFNSKQLYAAAKKTDLEVKWNSIIEILSTRLIDPKTFLNEFIKNGGTIASLDDQTKANIIVQGLLGENPNKSVAKLIKNFPDLKSELNLAMSKVILNESKVHALIELGVVPIEDNFEALLKARDIGPERLHLFFNMLEGIPDVEHAKKSLRYASAFGEEALDAAFQKFPELENDKDFLTNMLNEGWKGALIAANKMLVDVMTPGMFGPQPTKKMVDLPKKSFEALPVGESVSTEILVDILLPAKQFKQIQQHLVERPELINSFWNKCLFAGISEEINSGFEDLVQSTFSQLNENQKIELLKQSFQYSQEYLASQFIKHIEKLNDQDAFACFWFALQIGNTKLAEILLNAGYQDIRNNIGATLLHVAAEENRPLFVSLLLANGAKWDVKDQIGRTPYTIAKDLYLVTICSLMRGEEAKQEFISVFHEMQQGEMEFRIMVAFLNSSSVDILDIITKLRTKRNDPQSIEVLDRVEKFIRNSGTLIIRFPGRTLQWEMHQVYGKLKYPTYEIQQIEWGVECEKQYVEFWNESQNQDFVILEVLMKLANPRSKEKGYVSWRMNYPSREISLVTYFYGRYFFFWDLAQTVYKTVIAHPEKFKDELQQTEQGYRVFHKLNDNSVIPLTTTNIRKPFSSGKFKARFVHTEVSELKIFLPYLAKLFEEIKNFENESSDRLSPELKKKIAFFFWLGCHVAVTARGSSQYMLMIHRLLHNMHGFQPGPWAQKYVQPDCVAILLPFELFYDEYYDELFDYPPQPLVD